MKISIYILAYLAILGTFLPKNDSKHWLVRGQANFRAAYLFVDVVLIIVLMFFPITTLQIVTVALLFIGVLLCIKSIYRYTPLSNKTIASAMHSPNLSDISLVIHNVYQFNDQYDDLVSMVQGQDADIILLLEVSQEWDRAFQRLEESYPYQVKEVRNDTYGILMMSKLEPIEGGINHFVKDSIPSTEMLFSLNDQYVRVIGLHPEPPVPGEELTSEAKDKELDYASKYICTLPHDELQIVVGDLNDVAWSKSSVKFKETSGLVDPRVGRGFYSTFPAYSPIRIPLDHIFCTKHFGLLEFKLLDHAGSDHYAVFIHLQLPLVEKATS